ncbi:MAG: sigma-70 family RNA polymerase sigma factor [Planctomycetia bacterium]|nr:sigma-70 family RNA polymerase sigma factor [Planctomycetia bacterium]
MTAPVQTPDVPLACPDRWLIERFIQSRDEEVFRALVDRHGPMVWQVCRRLLRFREDAEDAFQATFLVLVRRAARIRKKESVASWLYGVAYRTSARLRSRRCRAPCPLDGAADVADASGEIVVDYYQRDLLDEELNRLPARYREPLVLYYLEGRSREEVSESLGLSPVVVKGRLQRGRDALRVRLAMRGVSLTLALAAIERCASAAQACDYGEVLVDAVLATTTAGMAVNGGCGSLSQHVVQLAGKEIGSMAVKLNAVGMGGCIAVVALGLVGQPSGSAPAGEGPRPELVQTADYLDLVERAPGATLVALDFPNQPGSATLTGAAAGDEKTILKYGDETADGRKSIAGGGEMIRFQAPGDAAKVAAIKLHGARYGYPQAPQEDFKVYLLGEDMSQVLHTELVPYARFERGDAKWVTLNFKKPVEVPQTFWVVVDFNAQATKGVYVSYDTSTGGEHSRVGLPGQEAKPTAFGGDWMIQAVLAK